MAAIGGIVAGIGSAAGGIMSGMGAQNAASTSASAQEQMLQTAIGLQWPQITSGYQALGLQDYMLGLGPKPGTLNSNMLTASSMTPVQQRTFASTLPGVWQQIVKNGGQLSWGALSTPQQQELMNSMPAVAEEMMGVGSSTSALGSQYGYGSLLQPFTAQQMYQDPGYQFRLQSSQNALQSAAAASGTYGSGTMAQALQQNAGNLASQEYGAAYQRYLEPFSLLGAVSGQGASAASGAAGLTGAAGSSIGNTLMQGGMASAQAMGQGINSGFSALQSGLNNYATNTNIQNLLTQIGSY